MRLTASVLFSFALSIGCAASPPAQSARSTQDAVPVYKANARAVVVDVVATKGSDEPLLALRKENFTVLEDGKPQEIDLFEEHSARTLPPNALKPLPPMPPGVYTNVPPAPESDAVNVLLIDTLNTERQDQVYVHKQMLAFLRTMQPGTRMAVFSLGSSLRFIQGFTTDSSVLIAAVSDKKGGLSPYKDANQYSRSDEADDADAVRKLVAMLGGHSDAGVAAMQKAQAVSAEFQYAQRVSMTLEALDYLARYLGGVPGRKNLLWFSGSFPVTIFPTPTQRQQMADARVLYSQVKKTADLLTVSKVAVYPINAEGMMNDRALEADNDAGAAGKGAGLMNTIMQGAGSRSDTTFAMEELAADTGGKAYYNTNDLNAAMNRAISDGSHYYTLVYTPTNKKLDGKYRRIEVKLNGSRAKLSYRRGYNADDTAAADPQPEPDPLRPLLMRGLPSSTQILYGVRVAPLAQQPPPNATRAGKNSKLTGPTTRYGIDFMIRWTDVKFQPGPRDAQSGNIQLGLLAYDRAGNAVNWTGATQQMNLEPGIFASIQKSGVPAHIEIDLPETDLYLQTGVYDWATRKAGTLEIPLHPARVAP